MTKEDRDIHRKLKALRHAEKTGHVARTCRYFGVGRSSFYLSIGVQMGPTLRAYRRAKGDHFRRGGEACASIKMRSGCRARGGGRA